MPTLHARTPGPAWTLCLAAAVLVVAMAEPVLLGSMLGPLLGAATLLAPSTRGQFRR
ncbi:MAG: hypothetical protein M3144_10700 [Actinomycetota bacterium]|nr:hypothetical protein [Actinomycetota bacterium]